ncbi:hypothetical protein P9112_002811 [Eukaryota sp. TZLM1-RC]
MSGLKCRVCGSSHFTLTDLGYYVCKLCATQVEEVNQLETAEYDDNQLGSTIYLKKGRKAAAAPKDKIPPVKYADIIEAFQLVLQLQSQCLVDHCGFPSEFDKVLLSFWFTFLERTASGVVTGAGQFPITLSNTLTFLYYSSLWSRLPFNAQYFIDLAAAGKIPFFHARKLLPSRLKISGDRSVFVPNASLSESSIHHSTFLLSRILSLPAPPNNVPIACIRMFNTLGLPASLLSPLLKLCSLIDPSSRSQRPFIAALSFQSLVPALFVVLLKIVYGLNWSCCSLEDSRVNVLPYLCCNGDVTDLPPLKSILEVLFDVVNNRKLSPFVGLNSFCKQISCKSCSHQTSFVSTYAQGLFSLGLKSSIPVFQSWVDFFAQYTPSTSPTQCSFSSSDNDSSIPPYVEQQGVDPSAKIASFLPLARTTEYPSCTAVLSALSVFSGVAIDELRKKLRSVEKALLLWTQNRKVATVNSGVKAINDNNHPLFSVN